MSHAKVLTVIPTYMEASNIEKVLSEVRTSAPEVDILVVDDNSPDGTAEIAGKVSEVLGSIHVLNRPGKDGLGSAYREGFAWGIERGYEVVVEMDADLSHDPDDLPRLLQRLDNDADLVVGSRYVPGGAVPGWPAHRALLSREGNRYAKAMLGLPLLDATSGYRAYRVEALRKVDLNKVRADGYGFQIEMAYRMHQSGARLAEVPITFVDRTLGKSKMSGRIIVEAMRLVTMWGISRRAGRLVRRVRRSEQKESARSSN